MAMKYVEGRAVDAIVEQQGPLPVNVATAILKYAAAGLGFAHERKVIHRDIKGGNILVDKDGRVMVADFGIARALEEVSMTASGMMIGTPYFMSPEQCGGQKVSPQSDQYSLGIMAFQLLTGELPFLADSMVGVIQHHYMTPVPDIRAVRSDVPQELLDVLYCALNKAPEDRFATTKDMALALENVPLTDAEREEAEQMLKILSMGQAIPKVRTGSLPPLMLTISGPGPMVHTRPAITPRARPVTGAGPIRKKKKKSKKALYLGVFVLVFTIGGAGVARIQENARQQEEQQRVAADSARAKLVFNDSVRKANAKGKIIFTGMPTGASVQLQGRSWYNGVIDSIEPGRWTATASAPGYQEWKKDLVVLPSATDTISVDMPASDVIAANPGNSRANAPKESLESAPVLFSVDPIYGKIYVDLKDRGEGRKQLMLTLGRHQIRFEAPPCTPWEGTIMVERGPTLVVKRTLLDCQ
jgi:hypothetical protein